MRRQCNMISFWRVVFTFVIMLFHFSGNYGVSTDWGIAVEFFFVVSGWLLAEDLKTHDRSAILYLKHRVKRLYPEYFITYVISIVEVLALGKMTIEELVKWFCDTGIRELLMIHYWGWGDASNYTNSPTWYVSVMLTAGYFLYLLLKKFPEITKELILPVAIIGFLTYSYRNFQGLMDDEFGGYLWHFRFWRGFGEMGIGVLLHAVNENYARYFKGKIVGLLGTGGGGNCYCNGLCSRWYNGLSLSVASFVWGDCGV